MTRRTDALGRLEQVARLKSDIEMRRFSAFRAHLVAARERVSRLEDDLQAIYDSDSSFSVTGARLTNAIACEKSRALMVAEKEVEQMLPAFDAARQRAVRKFGRAEVLKDMHCSRIKAAAMMRMRKLDAPGG